MFLQRKRTVGRGMIRYDNFFVSIDNFFALCIWIYGVLQGED